MFVFIRVMLADESYVPVNESYHYKMAFGLCAWKQTLLPTMHKLKMCDGKCATTLFNYAGKCPNLNFGKCLLENVLNSSVEKVRHCRTNSIPKKQHIWHFPGSGFLVGNSPSLLNGVGNLPSTVIYYWKMFDSHKQYRWDFLAAGKCATVICSIDKAFVTLENVLRS